MGDIWYRDLGFQNNPFSIKPALFSDEVVGCTDLLDSVSMSVLNGEIVFVQGDYGEGKTTVLKRLLKDFGGKKKVAYFSCNRIELSLDIKKLLNERYGILGRIFNFKPKNMILLLDEANSLGAQDFNNLYEYYTNGYFKSIVFVSKQFNKHIAASKLKSLIKQFTLATLSDTDAVDVIQKRVGKVSLLSDEIIKMVYNLSGKNIRVLLKNSEELCRLATRTGYKTVTKEFVLEFFGKNAVPPPPKKEERLFIPKKTVEQPKKSLGKAQPTQVQKVEPAKKPVKEKPAKEQPKVAEKPKQTPPQAETKKATVPEEKKAVQEKKEQPKTVIKEERKVYMAETDKEVASYSMEESLSTAPEEFLGSDYY